MEHQKVLWIVFSVTLFLVIVVVVGFVWFLPAEKESTPVELTAGVEASSKVFDPIVWVRDDEEVPGMSSQTEAGKAAEEAQGDLLLVYGETRVEKPVESGEIAGVRVVERPPVVIPAASSTTASAAKVVSSTATRVEPVSAGTRTAVTQTAAVKPATPATENVTQYWIQAGSFKSQSRAEETQSKLAEKGWNTHIISREVGGDIYFRVRLGPFDTKGEAGKFLDWITDIDSFESSYISQVYTTRAVN